MSLDPDLHTMASGPNFAAFTTLGPAGTPSTQIMWVDADGEHLLINTEIERQKVRNVERDPRVVVTVIDQETPYRYVEARGRVVGKVTGEEPRAHLDRLSNLYTGADYAQPIGSERVLLRIEVDRLHKQL